MPVPSSVAPTAPPPASSVAWDWRRSAGVDGGSRDREAAAARKRGIIQALVGLAVAVLFYVFWRRVPAYVVGAVAIFTLLAALASPLGLYRGISRALEAFGHFVGMAVTWVLMTVLYFLFVWPVGLLLRAAGKLGITTGFDRSRSTYWSAAAPRRGAESYRKQF